MSFIWQKRDVEPVSDDESVDPAVEAAAADRLRRLKGRSEEAPADVPAAARTAGGRIALARNPFAVLGVELASDVDAINRIHDELSFEPGHDPAQLTDARAALMSPRDRLDAELGWLPGLPAATLAATREALRSGDLGILAGAHDKASGMARLNLSAALAEARPQDAETAALTVADAQAVDEEALLDRLDEARFAAKVREIERPMFDERLAEHGRTIAERIASAFAATVAGRAALAQVLQQLPGSIGGFGATFRDALLRAYGAAIEASLEQSQARIQAGIEALRQTPGSQAHATTLVTALSLWSSLRRPVQVHEAARGLDDMASAAIFESVRSLLVALSNEHREFEIALRLGRALIESFKLVPMHRAALERELPTLIENAMGKRADQLRDAVLADPAAAARQIEAGGLQTSIGVAGGIAALVADTDMLPEDSREKILIIVRDIGIQLHNQHHRVKAAYILTAWLAEQEPPPGLAERLRADLQHFGVHAHVAARETAPAGETEAGESSAPPTFGRARRSDSAPPPAGSRKIPGQAPPKKKAIRLPASVRNAEGMGIGSVVLLVVIVVAVLWIRIETKSSLRARNAKPVPEASPSVTPTPWGVTGPPARQRRGESAEEIVRRWEAERRAERTEPTPVEPTVVPTPRPAPRAPVTISDSVLEEISR